MISQLRIFIRDVMFVSKLTGTKNKKIRIGISVLLIFATFGTDIIVIVIFASLFQDGVVNNNLIIDFFFNNLYLLPFVVLARFVFMYLDVLNSFKLKFQIEENLKVYLIKEVFNKGNYSIGDAFHFLSSFSASVGAFYHSLIGFISSTIQLSLYAIYLIYSDLESLVIVVGGAGFLYLPTKFFTKKGRNYAHIDWESGRDLNFQLQKILENIFLIKLLNKVTDEVNNFRSVLKTFYAAHLNSQKVGTLNTSFPQFATLLLLSILLAFFNFAKIFTLEFIAVLIRLFQEFSRVNKNIMLVSNNHVVIQKLYALKKNETSDYKSNFVVNPKLDKAISIKDLNFKYYNSDKYIFKDIDLEIEKNTHNVITGPNGSGKSTLLGLCSGLLYPEKGSITSYTSKYGYVGVTPLIVTGSLRNNLLYGNPKEVSDKVLNTYIDNFALFNEENKNHLDKTVSIKTLSSGQLQKISFIRALLGDIDILLLDESTSNLDKESKNLIFDILANSNLTILNATHNAEDFLTVDNHIKIIIKDDNRYIEG